MTIDYELIKQIKITPIFESLKLENIDDDTYFSEYSKEYISNSRLGKLVKDGVEAFFKNEPSPYNPSFETGSLIHTINLQGDDYEVIKDVFKPTAKAGLVAEALYKTDGTIPTDDEIRNKSNEIGYYKDKLTSNRLAEFKQKAEPYWRDRFLYETKNPIKDGDKKRIYTDQKNYELLISCTNSLHKNEAIQKLLHPEGIMETPITLNEHTLLMDIKMEVPGYEPKIYKLKAKLDNFTIDKENNVITVNDLKTSSKPASIFNPDYFHYQREIAFYCFLLKLYVEKYYSMNNPSVKGNFLVVSTVPEYTTSVVPMTPKLFKSGWAEAVYLLKNVAYFNQVKGYEF